MTRTPPVPAPPAPRAPRRRPGLRYGRMQLNITIIIALVIAAVGVIKYLGSTQKNPVTGEAQRVSLSPQQEVALGIQSAPQMAAQMGGVVPATDPRTQLVKRVGKKLEEQIPAGHPWKFQFHLLNDTKTVNAFALPGGQCFITVALLEQLQNEAQLAGVMGHEVGHVIHRHSAQRIAKGDLGRSLVTAVGVGASGTDGGQFAHLAGQVANDMIQKSYGRDAELESDRYGVEYMTKAGYDPREMVGVMAILKKASGGGSRPQFNSTHPDPDNRAERIGNAIKELYPQGLPANVTKGATLNRGLPSGGGTATPPKVTW